MRNRCSKYVVQNSLQQGAVLICLLHNQTILYSYTKFVLEFLHYMGYVRKARRFECLLKFRLQMTGYHCADRLYIKISGGTWDRVLNYRNTRPVR